MTLYGCLKLKNKEYGHDILISLPNTHTETAVNHYVCPQNNAFEHVFGNESKLGSREGQ